MNDQQNPLLSITSTVQQQEQLRQDLPQLHHRVIQPQLVSQPPRIPQQQTIQSPPIQTVQPVQQQPILIQPNPQQMQPVPLPVPQQIQQVSHPIQQIPQTVYIPQQVIRQDKPVAVAQQIVLQSQVAPPQQPRYPIGQSANIPQQFVIPQAAPIYKQPSTKNLER